MIGTDRIKKMAYKFHDSLEVYEAVAKMTGKELELINRYEKWGKEILVIYTGIHYMVCMFHTRKKKKPMFHMSSPLDSKLEALVYAKRKEKWLILEPHSGYKIITILFYIALAVNLITLITRIYVKR